MVWALVAAAVVWRRAGRGLPESERRVLAMTLAIAFALRLLAIGALVVAGAVRHADPSLGALLTGDEAYVLSRALRLRDILLGVAGWSGVSTHIDTRKVARPSGTSM